MLNLFTPKPPAVFSIVVVSVLFISNLCVAQKDQGTSRTIHVKFKERLKPSIPINGRSAISGADKVDKVSLKHKAVTMRRLFPDAGVFEAAHRAYGLHLWYEINLSEDSQLRNAIADYKDTEYFENVEERKPYSAIRSTAESREKKTISSLPSGPNDPLFNHQWHFENTGQMGSSTAVDINLVQAWKLESGSPNVIVAVIDGGINVNHPDLRNAMWVNSGEISGNGIDDDGNGYVDDIHGYGFGDRSANIYPDDHGTHVAGTIGAVSNNGIGVAGIAGGNGYSPGVRLMSCATFGAFGIGGFEAAMVYAADNGAVISQNSWGGGSSAIEAAIHYFITRAGYDNTSANFTKNIQTGPMAGGVVVFAVGNSNTSDPFVGYPASHDQVIAVASTDHFDNKSSFSNFGSWVDISAPGSNIYSTIGSSQYGFLSGTSMACPHVSGVAALVVSNVQRRGLKPVEVWNRLQLSAQPLDAKNLSYQGKLGWGRVDALLALKEPDNIPPSAITDLAIQKIHSTSLVLNWTASGENNHEGKAADFEIRYSKNPITEINFNEATLVTNAPAPPPSGTTVTYELKNLVPVTTYYVAMKSSDVFSNVSPLSNIVSAKTYQVPTPELVTAQVTTELYTGALSTPSIHVKNLGDEEELLVRLSVPELQPAPVLPPIGTTGKLFAINSAKNTIEQLDSKSGTLIRSIPMPVPSSKTVEGLAYDGTSLFYGRSQRIFKIDPKSGNIIETLEINGTDIINGLAWSGRYLYISAYAPQPGYRTLEFDVDKRQVVRTIWITPS